MPSDDGKRIREKILEGAEKVEADEMKEQQWEAVSSSLAYRKISGISSLQCPSSRR